VVSVFFKVAGPTDLFFHNPLTEALEGISSDWEWRRAFVVRTAAHEHPAPTPLTPRACLISTPVVWMVDRNGTKHAGSGG